MATSIAPRWATTASGRCLKLDSTHIASRRGIATNPNDTRSGPPKASALSKSRRLVTSARILPGGFERPALYDCHTKIPRCEPYPTTHHGGQFPWLLSAERQRIPEDDLEGASIVPWGVRQTLAHSLNEWVAQMVLGKQALDDVCVGARHALPHVAQTLSEVGRGGVAHGLDTMFTPGLRDRFASELEKLRAAGIELSLEVGKISSASVCGIRTQVGPSRAFGYGESASLSAGVARHAYKVRRFLGIAHAVPADSETEALRRYASVWGALQGTVPVRVRVDVEIASRMRYRLVDSHQKSSQHELLADVQRTTIVDDDAERNVVLTLESNSIARGDRLVWKVADIDYLLSSERRIHKELAEATK